MKLGFVITVLSCSIALALSQDKHEVESIGEYLEELAKEKSTDTGHGDKTTGEQLPGAELLESVKIEQPYAAGLWRNHAEMHFKKNNYHITLIEIVDNHQAHNGSATYEVFGGVGERHVDIDFESEPRSGIYYTVNVYGVREMASGEESIGEVSDVGSGLERKHVGAGSKTFGEREAGEELLHDQKIRQPWSCCGWKEYAEIHFKRDRYRVTRIVLEINPPNTDAASYDIYGGPGENYADFFFESHPFFGIWYDVKIYGKRN